MDTAMTALNKLINVNTRAYRSSLSGVSFEALTYRPSENSSPMIWIAGHVLLSRCRLAKTLGVDCDEPSEEIFSRGSSDFDFSRYPDIAEILEQWKDVSKKLSQRLSELTVEELAADSPKGAYSPDGTIRGMITFSFFHESYHLGQLGYLRKLGGEKGLMG